jgi:hypothetical protein
MKNGFIIIIIQLTNMKKKVLFWDIRSGQSVRSIFGPHLCGDSLDMCMLGDRTCVLTGSWRPEAPLEIWDFDTGKLIEGVRRKGERRNNNWNQITLF